MTNFDIEKEIIELKGKRGPENIKNKKIEDFTEQELYLLKCELRYLNCEKIKALKEKVESKTISEEKARDTLYYGLKIMPPDLFSDDEKSEILEYVFSGV